MNPNIINGYSNIIQKKNTLKNLLDDHFIPTKDPKRRIIHKMIYHV